MLYEVITVIPVLAGMEAVADILAAARHVEGSGVPVPEGEDEPEVAVEMPRRVAVMNLVLRGTDQNMAQPGRIGQPDVAVPQIVTEEIELV